MHSDDAATPTRAPNPSGTVAPVPSIAKLAGPFFVGAGVMHFVIPRAYRRIVPPYVPAATAVVYISGVAEIAGGVGLMRADHRRLSGWWLIATLLAVFPANIHMALHPDDFPKVPGGAPALYARLPVQAVFIAWVLSAMRAA
jgi:uncharacterized membrane protein